MAALPAQVPNLFCRDYFGDPANDPFNGDHKNAMDPQNVAENLPAPPATARTLACDAKEQGVSTAFILLHNDDNKFYVHAHLDKFSHRMDLAPTPWDNRMFEGKVELHHSQQTIV